MAKAARRGSSSGQKVTATKKAKPPTKRRRRAGTWVRAFIKLLEEQSLSISGAAREVGVSRNAVYARKGRSKAFAVLLHEAYEAGTDALEDEAVERARGRWVENIDANGKRTGKRWIQGSDLLLVATLNARRSDKWRRTPTAVAGNPADTEDRVLLCDVPHPSPPA